MKRKRTALTVGDKVEIIADSKNMKREEILKKWGIGKSTLSDMLKPEAIALISEKAKLSKERVLCREGEFPALEKALFTWFSEKRASHTVITGPLLQQKALEFARFLFSAF